MIPYVGVTGVATADQSRRLLQHVPQNPPRSLMVGVLASSKTLRGATNKWPKRYPKVEEIGSVFQDDSRALNLIHYSTDSPKDLCAQLLRLKQFGGPNLHGFQLNITWPPVTEIERYKELHPEDCIVLQIGSNAMRRAEDLADGVAESLDAYNHVIDSILLDASEGNGLQLDPILTRTLLSEISGRRSLSFGLGVAGGLGFYSLYLIEPFLRQFHDLSYDAEGKLRDKETDEMDMFMTAKYIEKSFGMIEEIARSERH